MPSNPSRTEGIMSAALEALQCHFTWDLDPSTSKLLRVKDKLEDIDADEANSWLGHIYNLQGYIHYKMGLNQDAKSFFSRAAEAFSQTRKAEDGPWLMVNYGNQAWLHHHLGEEAESQVYLTRLDGLSSKYPPPSQDELHPETYAEKAWTLMKFGSEQRLLATGYFQRAIRMQPDMVEWQSSHALALSSAFKLSDTGPDADTLEKMRNAKEQDPENLYLAVHYLEQLAKQGGKVDDEARELAQKILRNPVSSYSGMKALLRVYRDHVSVDEAIDLAEEALKKHPEQRYLKRCAAFCYKWKITFFRNSRPKQSTMDRAISLHQEVISLYPHSSLLKEIGLANIYAKSNSGQAKAEQIYQELLERELEPAEKQMLYNQYAKHLFFDLRDHRRSVHYHKKAAEIPLESGFRKNSLQVLKRIEERSRF